MKMLIIITVILTSFADASILPFVLDIGSSLPITLLRRTGCHSMSEHPFVQHPGRRAFLGGAPCPDRSRTGRLEGVSWERFQPDCRAATSACRWNGRIRPISPGTPQLPGYGQSSPVIFDQRIFVTGVEGSSKETLMLSAFDLSDGKELWTHRSAPAQSIQDSDMISKAAPTPIADAAGVYAFFETGNLVALDHRGRLRWDRRLTEEFGEFGGRHGIGSSLRLCQSGVMALVAHSGPSYLICVDPAHRQDRLENGPAQKRFPGPLLRLTEPRGSRAGAGQRRRPRGRLRHPGRFLALELWRGSNGPLSRHPPLSPARRNHRFQQKRLDRRQSNSASAAVLQCPRITLARLRGLPPISVLPWCTALASTWSTECRRGLLPGPRDRSRRCGTSD